jgi:phage shock protein PspC (stress-responsive transcriptional regulator)
MKKVININFQGRVIPIEETAYELLKQYIESLRKYFAHEEGRDEIINDIEGRIAELFSERLKKGSTCITDDDVNAVIASMGRPEDFEAQEIETPNSGSQQQQTYTNAGSSAQQARSHGSKRFTRNADDKILGGVCSGIANYLNIDPVIVRIIFVLLFGALFWVYILLWIIVPSQSVQSNITKRLYRNPDDKVIAGVCGGLASYFNIDTWIPRLIFALPLIIALISGSFNAFWWDWDFGFVPRVVSGSLGWTLFLAYVILWIAVPVASTAAEKLEMKGERIDLNSIRNTVKEDLEGFRSKAEKWGSEVKQSAQQFGEKAREFGQSAGTQAKSFAAEAAPIARRTGSGLGHVIGILFKAFFLFIAAILAITLFSVFIAILFGGFAVFPLKNFILEGFGQNVLAWTSLFLFLGVPIVALITWLIRRIVGVRSRNHYLGYVFASLWFIGLVCTLVLTGTIARNFRSRSAVEERISSFDPAANKIYVKAVRGSNAHFYGSDWFGIENDEGWPIYGINQDSLMLNTVRINLVRSNDSLYHIHRIRFSRGSNPEAARNVAQRINFDVSVQDSLVVLPRGFAISRQEKFRNQQVLVIIEVPVGRKIEMDRSLDHYDWFTVNFNRRRGWNVDWDDSWDNTYGWESNQEYIMTNDGLVKTSDLDPGELKNGRFRLRSGVHRTENGDIERDDDNKDDNREDSNEYRYPGSKSDTTTKASISDVSTYEIPDDRESNTKMISTTGDLGTPLAVFSKLFQ